MVFEDDLLKTIEILKQIIDFLTIYIHGDPWVSMDIDLYPWISNDIHRYPWISLDRISIDFHGCPWISIHIYGYPQIQISIDTQ